MPGNSIGSAFRVTTWGESHGRGVGVVIDGCPADLSLSSEDVQKELDRRRPGQSKASTARDEADRVEILSGIFDNRTTGCPISMLVWNKDAQSKSYEALRDRPRPGHADLAYQQKYGIRDHRGGGRASARETVGRVAAGAVAKKMLAHWGVDILGYVAELAGIEAEVPDWLDRGEIAKDEISRLRELVEANPIRSPDKAEEMLEAIEKARGVGESVGGIVQIIAAGVPPGLGEPVFSKLDADLASALMSIGAVKAVEIGAGVASARLRGSEMNDSILPGAKGPAYGSNRAGGILGGISTGAPILARIAVKPTPSIARPQRTVDLRSGEAVEIEIKGRHDPAIPPRIIPVAEAMVALVLADHFLRDRASRIRD